MSGPVALTPRDPLPPRRRVAPLLVVQLSFLLAKLRPARLRRVLEFARRGARPAGRSAALAARENVVSVSLRCAGQNCLQRSIATALLCRVRGSWPDWCTGIRTNPFAAHAWVEVDGEPIGEPYPPGHYSCLLRIPPARPAP